MGGFQGGDFPYLEVFFDEFLAGLMFDGVEWVSLGSLGYEQVLELNGVVV